MSGIMLRYWLFWIVGVHFDDEDLSYCEFQSNPWMVVNSFSKAVLQSVMVIEEHVLLRLSCFH